MGSATMQHDEQSDQPNATTNNSSRRSSRTPRRISVPLPPLHPQSLSCYAEIVASRRKRTFGVTSGLSGWRSHQPSKQEILDQTKSLCARYLRSKLRSSANAGKKLGLQRLKSVSNVHTSSELSAVGLELRQLSLQLERTHPKLFHSVTANVGLQSLTSEGAVQNLFLSVARHLITSSQVNWGKVVAVFSVAGALAMDCVRMGHPEFVLGLVEGVANFVDRHLAIWISNQGGWVALLSHFRKQSQSQCSEACVTVAILVILSCGMAVSLWLAGYI